MKKVISIVFFIILFSMTLFTGCVNTINDEKDYNYFGLRIIQNPYKVIYTEGESLDLSGLMVNMVFSDGHEEAFSDFKTTPANGEILDSVGQKKIVLQKVIRTSRRARIFEASFYVFVEQKSVQTKIYNPSDNFVFIEGGTVFGSNTGGVFPKNRNVTLSSFYMCDHEVTQAEYLKVMGTNPSSATSDPASGEAQACRPVDNISWYEAIVYCNRLSLREGRTPCYYVPGVSDWNMLPIRKIPEEDNEEWNNVSCNFSANGYRLPTEAEWEYAARGGQKNYGSAQFYDDLSSESDIYIHNAAWIKANSSGKTHEVRKKSANVLGLYDMAGNVSELCWDWTETIERGNITNPQGAYFGSERIIRGGSKDWNLKDTDEGYYSKRNSITPFSRDSSVGLRVVYSSGGYENNESTMSNGDIVRKVFTQPDFIADGSTVQGGWAYTTYSLADFEGKKVTIDFSCEMKVENSGTTDSSIMWQINNNGSYPVIADYIFKPSDTNFIPVIGKITVSIEKNVQIYLGTYQLDTENLRITVRNISYTITYYKDASENPVQTTNTYPTDIFTVGYANSCGITLRGTKEPFTIFTEGSKATNIKTESDGSVSWITTAAGGGGGGVAFYVKSSKEEINFANYDSIDIELVYSPVNGYWNSGAQNPGFCMRILPWDSTGIFGGYEDLEYFDSTAPYGTLRKNIRISNDFVNIIKNNSGFDSVLGFAIRFNDYNRGNSDGDQLKVQLKSVKFNPKADAVADKAFDDGLTDAQRGTVVEINYPTRDYTVAADKVTDADKYNKHGWVYLPAGYDANDKDTKYPVFILLHGYGQNENTWGLSDQRRGRKIKGYMDRGMASGEVEKFILVCVTGVADKTWGPNGSGNSLNGFNAFGGELRNDLLPHLRENYNIADGRDNVAIAGLSMGGAQTFNIGIGECLDLISNFAGFSGALFSTAEEFTTKVDGTAAFDGLKIHNLYMICGDADDLVYGSFPGYVDAMKAWSRVENFESYVYPGGTHDFPVWYYGFNDFIHMVFQEGIQLYND